MQSLNSLNEVVAKNSNLKVGAAGLVGHLIRKHTENIQRKLKQKIQ